MRTPKGIRDNLSFLTAEAAGQVTGLRAFLRHGGRAAAKRMLERSGYSRNLKLRIQEGCLKTVMAAGGGEVDLLSLRAMETVAADLERITRYCRDCVQQVQGLPGRRLPGRKRVRRMLRRVLRGIGLIDAAVAGNDIRLALRIGRVQHRLQRECGRLRRRHMRRLRRGRGVEGAVAGLFLAHYLEQMGGALLSISESVISANLGQPVSIDRYRSMKASIRRLQGPGDGKQADLSFEPIAETRSGSAIAGIGAAGSGYVAIYKDGVKRKLKEERQGVENWHQIFPGLAPRILDYRKNGRSASLLIEHLAGLTFEQILLHESEALLQQALAALRRTLRSIWRETRVRRPVAAGYMEQLTSRLAQVYAIHPEFQLGGSRIGRLRLPSLQGLIDRAQTLEQGLPAPFSVYIHGDFNLDNIIFDPGTGRINFIDLHRSRYMDYVQDVSVFMVSVYRLQILDLARRRRILRLSRAFHRFARKTARRRGDDTFEIRLALGLARSFITSTRFILDKSLARAMFLRGRYLIEQVVDTDPAKAAGFRLPVKELFIA
ncbi:MAG TPA: hypothetical protein ENI96_05110 [Sedimenticola thiotaurini]|uniref:Aminoglycoside phosphotransferase domain-containing protein n=1 Tax=Sedimenticola thiotaurini TaxID=1543721 RepID=A0A831W4S1_9GAMM|nr:hypothetical protein [Sedimenticola thiotaurini]